MLGLHDAGVLGAYGEAACRGVEVVVGSDSCCVTIGEVLRSKLESHSALRRVRKSIIPWGYQRR